MNTIIKLLRKNLVLITSIALVCLVAFCAVQYGPAFLKMINENVEKSVDGAEEESVGAPLESEVNATGPPKDERPVDGACGSKKVTFNLPETSSVNAFDPSDEFSNVTEDATKSSNGEGLIDKLSQVLA